MNLIAKDPDFIWMPCVRWERKEDPTANNHVGDVIEAEGCEAVVPGLLDFFLYSMSNAQEMCIRDRL